jgi:hypothetical protein
MAGCRLSRMAYFNPSSLAGLNGSVAETTAAALLPKLITNIDLYTNVSPPSNIANANAIAKALLNDNPDATGGSGSAAQAGFTAKLLAALQPTFQVDSPVFGTRYYAPYGVISRDAHKAGRMKLLLGLAAVAGGFVLIGYAYGKKAR